MSVVALVLYSIWRYRDSSCVVCCGLLLVVGSQAWRGGGGEGEGGGRGEGEGEGPHSREPRNFPETDRPQLLEPLFAWDDQAYTVKKVNGKIANFFTVYLRQKQAELSTKEFSRN
jgi:hypothetical protein